MNTTVQCWPTEPKVCEPITLTDWPARIPVWFDSVTVFLTLEQSMKLSTDLYGMVCKARPPRSPDETPAQSAALGRASNEWQARVDRQADQAVRLELLEEFIESRGLVNEAQAYIEESSHED